MKENLIFDFIPYYYKRLNKKKSDINILTIKTFSWRWKNYYVLFFLEILKWLKIGNTKKKCY